MTEFSLTNADHITLLGRHWPVGDPRAVIALVHGQGEHCGRYQHVAEWFNKQGYAMVSLDLQGYGRSGGKRGHARTYEALLDDVALLLDETRKLYPHSPLVLYGHSMGGNLALNYTLRRQPPIQAMVVTGSLIRLAFPAPAIKIRIGKLLRNIFPSLSLPTDLPAKFLSRDSAVVTAYEQDPLVHGRLSAAAGIDLLDAAADLNNWSGPAPVPMLIMHGGADQITDPGGSRDLAERLFGDVSYREWPGLYHEIHNEPEKEQIFKYVLGWLSEKIK